MERFENHLITASSNTIKKKKKKKKKIGDFETFSLLVN